MTKITDRLPKAHEVELTDACRLAAYLDEVLSKTAQRLMEREDIDSKAAALRIERLRQEQLNNLPAELIAVAYDLDIAKRYEGGEQ